MSAPQIIRTPNGEELVVLSRAEYEVLVERADHADNEAEDAADVATYDARKTELAAGGVVLPPEVSAAVLRGDSRLKAIRKWRRRNATTLGVQNRHQSGLSVRSRKRAPHGNRRDDREARASFECAGGVASAELAGNGMVRRSGPQTRRGDAEGSCGVPSNSQPMSWVWAQGRSLPGSWAWGGLRSLDHRQGSRRLVVAIRRPPRRPPGMSCPRRARQQGFRCASRACGEDRMCRPRY